MGRFGQFVPISMLNRERQTMKLEFSLQVYFFVFSVNQQLSRKRGVEPAAKQAFIQYLEGRGAALAKSAELLQYYALGYLQKPQEHPTFKAIFTKDWIQKLRQQLTEFLDNLYPAGKNPALINIYDRFIEKSLDRNEEQSLTEPEIEELIDPEDGAGNGNEGSAVPYPQSSREPESVARSQEPLARYPSMHAPNTF
jgi:hypothetical protein